MKFNERLKARRTAAGLTQEQLAKATGITARTIQNYELGTRRPRYEHIVERLAEALDCTTADLLGNGGSYIMDAQEKGGTRSAREIEDLVSEVTGLFAGGSMDEDAMDGVYRALSQAYWDAKDRNKQKYTPRKYRPESHES